MHNSAMLLGSRFFESYVDCSISDARIVDIGSQNVNGSLRDVAPEHCEYIGVDFARAPGVDIVLDDPYTLPFADASIDYIVSSSCFEHSAMFWLLFLEILRVLKPGGLFYLNAPSNGDFHRYPVDAWRFYPDAGLSLCEWGVRNGYDTRLLESFVNEHADINTREVWNDYVAIFLKFDPEHALPAKRIYPSAPNPKNIFTAEHPHLLSPEFSPQDQRRWIAAYSGLSQKLASRNFLFSRKTLKRLLARLEKA